MINQNIYIIELEPLYCILNEIENNFHFKIFNYPDKNIFLDQVNSNQINLDNSLILVKKKINNSFEKINIDKKNIYIFDETPISIDKLIEKINVKLIKNKYEDQSKIYIKDYIINLNSRIIIRSGEELKLTEKEINIILFLNNKTKPQKINILENKVWGHSSVLETHTVETHIYRLRKKINDKFNDNKFIKTHNDGYFIE
jgi:hypothetical protein